MIPVQNRIDEIMQRIGSIHKRFNSIEMGQRSDFKNTLMEMQEKIFNEGKHDNNKYDDIIIKNAKRYTIPERLIKSVIKQESNYNPKAVSSKGAKGLMQLMPQTAKLLGVTNVFDPEENISGGVKYLKQMLDRFDGDVVKALAAYNAGPKAVEDNNGVPNYSETKNYVSRILDNMEGF
ncbi:MAG: lytic transglycosylase domain-containing protein [Spirochaetes bacterium]|nr:lytic transglycosylase domain-containing protein [Spirochaetota bacterium]